MSENLKIHNVDLSCTEKSGVVYPEAKELCVEKSVKFQEVTHLLGIGHLAMWL